MQLVFMLGTAVLASLGFRYLGKKGPGAKSAVAAGEGDPKDTDRVKMAVKGVDARTQRERSFPLCVPSDQMLRRMEAKAKKQRASELREAWQQRRRVFLLTWERWSQEDEALAQEEVAQEQKELTESVAAVREGKAPQPIATRKRRRTNRTPREEFVEHLYGELTEAVAAYIPSREVLHALLPELRPDTLLAPPDKKGRVAVERLVDQCLKLKGKLLPLPEEDSAYRMFEQSAIRGIQPPVEGEEALMPEQRLLAFLRVMRQLCITSFLIQACDPQQLEAKRQEAAKRNRLFRTLIIVMVVVGIFLLSTVWSDKVVIWVQWLERGLTGGGE